MSSATDSDGPASDDGGEDTGDAEERLGRPLPESVRARVIEYAAEVLGGLPDADLPAPLRRVARFEPRRRSRLAGPQIGAQLESDSAFRRLVGDRVRQVWPELSSELGRGVVPPATEPDVVAAAAYVLRPEGWATMVRDAQDELERRSARKEAREADEELADLRARLEEQRKEHRHELDRLRGELRSARSTIADLRRQMHAERGQSKDATSSARRERDQLAEERDSAQGHAQRLESQVRRLRARLERAEEQREIARRAERTGRNAESARLRMLVDLLMDTAHGLRSELALPAATERPADVATRDGSGEGNPPGVLLGIPTDDPTLIDRLLTLPGVHLLIDGYNVTQGAYGQLPLADQRRRLLTGLQGLATRTKAEITCVFDGADVEGSRVSMAGPVRVLFSKPNEIADDVIVRLVYAEPQGRPVAVVSSDQEIVTTVRRAGARPVPSEMLARRLGEH
ncbi:NYN domain-containing protein [Spiractinospora alimapuensis]|uniref:NYN domain-containing protein n=1 Tax=Spiractinospora alimapuensis TaxID=2820884 RepID=UPI001F157632|nr:NYN domain-containing protein [Spiractinospora alimapuensis]QVQ53231.1 NYN domain-containing protein [Spiractinospora alimapuensis]